MNNKPTPDGVASEGSLEAQQAHRLEAIYESLQCESSGRLEDSELHELQGAIELLRSLDRAREKGHATDATPAGSPKLDGKTPFDVGGDLEFSARENGSEVPARIGKFDVHGLVGQGGYGRVYEAEDRELNRKVALKIPRPEVMLDSYLKRRFLQEAIFAASLNHPNMVRVYDAGEANGVCYIAYEYCSGLSLAQWLRSRKNPLTPLQAARMVAVLADAIQAAHRIGIVHRDLKPSNVMLLDVKDATVDFDSRHACKILDFGLAKSEATTSDLTHSGAIIGTMAYLAPEQATAGALPVGPSADLFSLGVILYELLTLENPFRREEPLKTLQAIRSPEPTAVRRRNPHVPKDLEAICHKCLQESPEDRYASAAELEQDLLRFARQEPVTARPIRPGARAWRWARRHPVQATLGSATIVLLLVAGIAVTTLWLKAETNYQIAEKASELAETNRRQAVVEKNQAEANLDVAHDAIDEFISNWDGVLLNEPRVIAKRDAILRKALDLQNRLVETYKNRKNTQFHKAKAHYRLARLKAEIGELDAANQECELGLEACRLAEESKEVEKSQKDMAEDSSLDDFFEDEELLKRDLYRVRARIASMQWRIRAASQDMEKAILSGEAFLKRFSDGFADPSVRRMVAEDLQVQGTYYSQSGEMDKALSCFQRSLAKLNEIEEEACDTEDYHLAVARTRNSLAIDAKMKGDLKSAQENYENSIAGFKAALEYAPDRVETQFSLAQTQYNFGNLLLGDAETELDRMVPYNEALATFERLEASFPDVPDYRWMRGRCLFALGLLFKRQGDYRSAETHYVEARGLQLELIERYPQNSMYKTDLTNTCGNLSSLYMVQKRWTEAETVLEQAVETQRELVEAYPKAHSYRRAFATALINQGTVRLKREDFETASGLFRTAVSHQAQALRQVPQSKKYRNFLHQDVQLLATSLCELSQFGEAVLAVEVLRADEIRSAASEIEAAAIWCTIASATEANMQVSPSFHQTLVAGLDQRALSRLLQAVENGTLSKDQLKDPRFKRLRRYDSFPELPSEDEEEVPGD